ncbi:MAG: rRNA maturation RNase YbeY [Candidatus Acidiferrales bacterium]
MILNQQRAVRVPLEELERFLERLRRLLGAPAEAVSICLVSDRQIARWNRLYRGKNRATDVLSFPAHEDGTRSQFGSQRYPRSVASNGYWGDIAIAPAVARKNSRRIGRTLDSELRLLILHGVLHLMGYDHESDRGEMERYEKRLRRKLALT